MAARQRELGAAAHAVAMDRGDRGAGQFRDPLEHLLPAKQRVLDGAVGVEGLEFLDVGAGHEARCLARAEHHTARWIDREPLDQRTQFDQHVLRQGIHRLAGAIDRHDHDAVVARLDLPVRKAKSIEARGLEASSHKALSGGVWRSQYHPGAI